MTLIWATRGRGWGFRFLRDGGLDDPLAIYESVFSGLQGESAGFVRVGDRVGLRFPDPEGRTDRSGRRIPHDFVISGEMAEQLDSLGDGIRGIWPLVADRYAEVWDAQTAPTVLHE